MPNQEKVLPTHDDDARRKRRRKVVAYSGGGAVIVIIGVIYFVFFSVAVYRTVEEGLEEVRRQHPDAQIKQDPATGFVSAMANLESTTKSNRAIAPAAAGGFAKAFVEQPEVAVVLGIPKEAEIRVASQGPDPQLPDYNIVRMEQFVNSVRVFGADIAVSMRSGPGASISSVAIRPETVPDIDPVPAIDEAAARASAMTHYASLARDPARRLSPDATIDDRPERVIFEPKRLGLPGQAALAFLMRIDSVHVFVDAKDAHVILSYDDRQSVLNRITHDCQLTAACPVVISDTPLVSPTASVSRDARDVHAAVEAAHGYFKRMFNRDGFDDPPGPGGPLPTESFVQIFNFPNAQWLPTQQRFEFGAGWTTLDIAAHEYTHAVTTFGPKLTYFGESGSVNEFFSDFFGAMVERDVTNSLDWHIGEGLPGHSLANPLRNMADPHNGGFDRTKPYNPATNGGQPKDFDELVKASDTICAAFPAAGDSGCVHFNSGILNRAMVLAIDGGTVNGATLTPIARAKVEQIMFRTLIFGGVTSASNLKDTATGAVTACGQLAALSKFGITTGDCAALAKAFAAVKL